MDTTTNSGTNGDTTYSHMEGVFRERKNAEQALNELKQAGFRETELTVYDPHPAEEAVNDPRPAEEAVNISLTDSGMRFLVQVLAGGREKEAVEILVSNGANNADLPPGTKLSQGSIIGSTDATDAQGAIPSTAGTSSDSFFGTAKTPGQPNDIRIMDNPDNPRS